MSRFVSVCLCAVVAFVALTGAPLLSPAPVLAASGTLSMETPLHESPAHGAPLIALLPEGTVVSIDGPPTDGFYPVSTADLSGWMRGETLLLEKDVADETVDATAADVERGDPNAVIPAEQTADDGAAPIASAGAADPATDPALAVDPSLQAPMADQAKTAPATDVTDAAPVASPATAPAVPAETAAPAPVEASAPDVVAEAVADATPIPAASASETPADESTTREPNLDPDVTPIPRPEPAPLGPASVTVDAPIRSGPGPNYGLIFTVPRGSTLEQTGQLIDGFVSVQYKEVTGWTAFDHLGQPIAFVEETVPEETVEPVEAKTPRAGSGVAFTTVDLSLRSGPSANEEPVAAVPAGSRVVLTGVMEGNFQRVTFRDQIGWVSNDFLQTPADPEPNSGGSGKQQNYSEQQIVRIIYAAADQFDQPRSDMLRVARCESNLNPYAVNPSGSYGLFQFIRSTWKSTPYGGDDIFDPRANATAAAWMWSEGRKSEWVCQ